MQSDHLVVCGYAANPACRRHKSRGSMVCGVGFCFWGVLAGVLLSGMRSKMFLDARCVLGACCSRAGWDTCRAGADDSEMCRSFLYLQVLLCPLFLQNERAVAYFCQTGCQVQIAVRQAAFPLALSELTAERGFGGSVEVRGVSEWSKSVPVLSNRAAKSPWELALFMSQQFVYLWSSWVSLVNIKKC